MNSGCSLSCGCGLVGVALAVDDVVPPDVAALDPVDLGLGAAHHEHLLDRVRRAASASSTAGLSGAGLPRRNCPSVVTTTLHWASSMRVCRASAEKPPKITEWGAPSRAQASMVNAVSGIIGM